jgi:PhnB protein
MSTVHPYLSFDGRTQEALDFYRKAIDAKVTALLRFKDAPDPNMRPADPAGGEKIMHSRFEVGDTTILASDGRCQGKPVFHGVSLSLFAENDDDAKRYFAALSDGGAVDMPMSKTFFASSFGMVQDRFSVSWMIIAGAH